MTSYDAGGPVFLHTNHACTNACLTPLAAVAIGRLRVEWVEWPKPVTHVLSRPRAGTRRRRQVEDMLKIARRMFHELGCAKYVDEGDSFACDNGDPIVSDATMLSVLAMIERRASELILSLIRKKALEVDDQPAAAGIQAAAPSPHHSDAARLAADVALRLAAACAYSRAGRCGATGLCAPTELQWRDTASACPCARVPA